MALVEHLKAMSEERFLAIYQSLEAQGYGPLDQHVAESLRFRLPAIRRLPMEKRAKRARQLLSNKRMTELAYELFGSYLMKHKKELITGFLDATDVAHEDGMIEDVGDAARPRTRSRVRSPSSTAASRARTSRSTSACAWRCGRKAKRCRSSGRSARRPRRADPSEKTKWEARDRATCSARRSRSRRTPCSSPPGTTTASRTVPAPSTRSSASPVPTRCTRRSSVWRDR